MNKPALKLVTAFLLFGVALSAAIVLLSGMVS